MAGIGGGPARDLILGVPVFWVEQPLQVLICATTAIGVFFTAHLLESRYRLLLWLDAEALAAYGVFGAYKGLLVTGSPMVAAVMGMLTGTLGGILRDVLADEPSVLMRKEIYITAVLAGRLCYVATSLAGLPLAAGFGFAVALFIRSGALPSYKARPGRNPDDVV